MLDAPVGELSVGPDWVYEPKWDGWLRLTCQPELIEC